MKQPEITTDAAAIFFISAAVLGLELILVRIFSIGHWHHFSFMVISTALLGFGAGATFIALKPELFTKNYEKKLCFSAFFFGLSVPAVFLLSQKVPLDELQLIWDSRQLLFLFSYYLLFFIPFFFAGVCIALAFVVFAEKIHRIYFFNMAGSALGVACAVGLMYKAPVQQLLLVVSSLAFLAAVLFGWKLSKKYPAATILCALIALSGLGFSDKLEIKISENKSLAYYRALPDAEVIATRNSPLARLDCLRAPAVRYFPGLSIAYQGKLPEQILIISDADGISAVNHFKDANEAACFDYMTSAAGYHLLDKPSVCIIGAGGGSDVVQALSLGAEDITAVEMNPDVINLVRKQFGRFSGDLYNRKNVKVIEAEARNFLQTTNTLFDIINISLLDSLTASAAGLYTLNESHLYTIEAIEQTLCKLQPDGILSITRMLKTPPRDSLKTLATAAASLRRKGITDTAGHIIMLRNWAAATILVSPQPFSRQRIAKAREFAELRGFDLVHIPGISPKDVNKFHILEEPAYYQSARRILSENYRNFYDNYAYNIRPATDDRPYFFDFFKWRALPHMFRTIPGRWLTFSEWGYLVLAATLLQSICASFVLLLLPLFIAKPIKQIRSGKWAVVTIFFLLGAAYMFLEMGFIQKMTLLIGQPVFGVAVTITGFLFFTACGSLASACLFRNPLRRIRAAVMAIILAGLIDIAVLSFFFDRFVSFSKPGRILLGLVLIAAPAFFMGIPFPTALKQLHIRKAALVPWALGVNGFASVTGAVMGTFLAVSLGFTSLIFIALACYFLCAVIAGQVCR